MEQKQTPRSPFVLFAAEFPSTFRVICDDLAGAVKFPFVNQQAFKADCAAGVDFVRADTHLRAEACSMSVSTSGSAGRATGKRNPESFSEDVKNDTDRGTITFG